ncbi:MAG: fasciclin domain-containing protein [Hyphomonas sp.]|nr:fasciclin domain-containing protein [Hyphomonas sp.]
MRHLFVSCAAVALMAAPALAQATYETTEPLVESEESIDPTLREQPVMPTEFEQEAEVTPESAPVQAADAATDDDTFADNALPSDETVTAGAPVAEGTEMAFEAEAATETTTVAETEPMFDTATVVQTETFAEQENVAALPEDYSTDDLNAMMLAQLNVVAVEIAEANAEAGTNVYASADTFASTTTETAMTGSVPAGETATEDYASVGTYTSTETETAMTESVPAEQTATEDYASTESRPEVIAVSPEVYAAIEPAGPAFETDVAAPSDETGMMAEETDGSLQMADHLGHMTVTAEGDIDQTAVEIAARDDRFTTLVELVGIAGLEEALSLDGPYTVFAPTNEAFAALPEATLAHLKSEAGKAELVEILQAHVVEGTVMAGEVPMTGQTVETIGDRSLNVTGSIDGSLNVQGSNTIGEGVSASNGVVYAVDAVILPEVVPAGTDN